jgi:hypothetical protein
LSPFWQTTTALALGTTASAVEPTRLKATSIETDRR